MLLNLIHLNNQINDQNYILYIYFAIYKKISMESNQENSVRLRQFWKNQQIRNYICNQIEQANLSIHLISTKCVYLKFQLDAHQKSHHLDPNTFIIALSLSFPIQPPQIFLLNSYISPSLKDYRDLLSQLIGQSWNCELHTLKKLVSKIPDFLMDLDEIKGNFLRMQKIGSYHPNKYYEFGMLKQLSEHEPFVAFEHLQEQINLYVISVTTCHFLLFKPTMQPYFQENKLIVPKQEDIKLMRLVFVAEIQSLIQLTHTREDKNEYKLTFFSVEIKKLEINKKVWSKSLKITRSTKLIELLIKSGKHFGVDINLQVESLRKHSEEDELLAQVALKQQKVKHYFNKSTLLELSQTYQKLVEYYSSVGLPYNQIYVHKIATLYHREDVKLILGSDSPIKSQ